MNSYNKFRNIILILLLSLSILDLHGQNDKLFTAVSVSAVFDRMNGPVRAVDTGVQPEISTQFSRVRGADLAAVGFELRYNLVEFNYNFTLSASATPQIGIFESTQLDIIRFGLPLTAGIEYGAGSTYNSEKNFGVFFRIGFEYNFAPIFLYEAQSYGPEGAIRHWVIPTSQFGFRTYVRNRLYTLMVRYGVGGESLYEDNEVVRANSLRVSLGVILNY